MNKNGQRFFQPSILNYTKTREGKNTLSLVMKPYFYLDWNINDKFYPTHNAQWFDEKFVKEMASAAL